MVVLLKIEGNCSCLRAKVAHMVGHLPLTAELLILIIQVGVTESVGELGDLLEARLHVFGDLL
jgi:hypothetical protein